MRKAFLFCCVLFGIGLFSFTVMAYGGWEQSTVEGRPVFKKSCGVDTYVECEETDEGWTCMLSEKGELVIESSPGNGTSIKATVPVTS